jgi:hypothetical protein
LIQWITATIIAAQSDIILESADCGARILRFQSISRFIKTCLFIDWIALSDLPSPNHRVHQNPTDHRICDFDHSRLSLAVTVVVAVDVTATATATVTVAAAMVLMVVVIGSVSVAVTVNRAKVEGLRWE